MKLNDEKKSDILLKLLEENGKSVEWLKELDFKISYYTLALFLALIAWLASNVPNEDDKWVFYVIVALTATLSVVFLIRNHSRHATLNFELDRVHTALLLKAAGEYAPDVLVDTVKNDWEFHLGRILYGLFILAAAVVTCIFLARLKS